MRKGKQIIYITSGILLVLSSKTSFTVCPRSVCRLASFLINCATVIVSYPKFSDNILACVVLPEPGGPTNQIIGRLRFFTIVISYCVRCSLGTYNVDIHLASALRKNLINSIHHLYNRILRPSYRESYDILYNLSQQKYPEIYKSQFCTRLTVQRFRFVISSIQGILKGNTLNVELVILLNFSPTSISIYFPTLIFEIKQLKLN